MQDDFGLAAFGETEREADVLEPGGEPPSLRSEVVAEGNDAIGEKGAGSGRASSSSACREHAVMTSRMLTLGHDGLGDAVVAVDEGVAKTHLDRIDPEFGGKPVDRRLDRGGPAAHRSHGRRRRPVVV